MPFFLRITGSYLAIMPFLPQNYKFISRNSDFIHSNSEFTTNNCEFIFHDSVKKSKNCEIKSCNNLFHII